jgi:hypothetical protein
VPGQSGARRVRNLPALTLVGDLSEAPARWTPVMFVPFGDRSSDAGALLKKKFASLPIVPPSFAVDRDGSLWLLDLVKRRISHYDARGRFTGAIEGLEFDRFSPYAQDLAFAGDGLWVMEHEHRTLRSFVRSVGRTRIGPRLSFRAGGRAAVISRLVSPQSRLTAFVIGTAGAGGRPPSGGGTSGYFAVPAPASAPASASGDAKRVLGPLLVDGTRLGAGPEVIDRNESLLVHHETGGVDSRRVLYLRVQPSPQSDRRIPVAVGWETYAVLPHGFATYVGLSPVRGTDQDRYGGARWLLEYFDDGQPLVWERLPESTLAGARIWRYLAEGLDGHLYLMLAEKRGMRIYRRPGPPAR